MSTILEEIGLLSVRARKADRALHVALERYDKEKAEGKEEPTSYEPQRVEFIESCLALSKAIDVYISQEAVNVEG
jgi:hypothetical protein